VGARALSDLRPWSSGIWIAEAPLRFYGIAGENILLDGGAYPGTY